MKKSTMGFIVTVAILTIILAIAAWSSLQQPQPTPSTQQNNPPPTEQLSEQVSIQYTYPDKIVYTTDQSTPTDPLKQDCAKREGTFNECGTICPTDATTCAQVCAYTCQLQNQQAAIPAASVNLYLVSIDDQGKNGELIGCGDSVIPVKHDLEKGSGSIEETIRMTLADLLTAPSATPGSDQPYNALASSKITIDSLALTNGKLTLTLSGTLNLGGVCDDPRVEAQVEKTIKQFPEVKQVEIFLNGKLLHEALSEKE